MNAGSCLPEGTSPALLAVQEITAGCKVQPGVGAYFCVLVLMSPHPPPHLR